MMYVSFDEMCTVRRQGIRSVINLYLRVLRDDTRNVMNGTQLLAFCHVNTFSSR